MAISSDVNTIFAYTNPNHKFHRAVCLYIAKKKRYPYFLLAKVSNSFVFTYKNLLADCGNIIIKEILEYREERNKSGAKYKLNAYAISAIINKKINSALDKSNSQYLNFDYKTAKEFIDKLLSDFSIPEMFENDHSLGEFREKYVTESEKRAAEKLNEFLNFFQNFETIKIEQYDNYDVWLQNIKSSKNPVFKNKQDFEDMKIAAEFLSYNQDFGQLSFFSSDKDMIDSIIQIGKEYRQRVGDMNLIKVL